MQANQMHPVTAEKPANQNKAPTIGPVDNHVSWNTHYIEHHIFYYLRVAISSAVAKVLFSAFDICCSLRSSSSAATWQSEEMKDEEDLYSKNLMAI